MARSQTITFFLEEEGGRGREGEKEKSEKIETHRPTNLSCLFQGLFSLPWLASRAGAAAVEGGADAVAAEAMRERDGGGGEEGFDQEKN